MSLRSILLILFLLKPMGFINAVELRFGWPDKSGFTETSHREIITEVAGSPNKENDVEDSTFEWHVQKEKEGYRISKTMISEKRAINGKSFENPSKPVLIKHPYYYFIDASGKFLRLDGHQAIADRMKEIFPEELHARIDDQFSPRRLEEAEHWFWWREIERFIGHQATTGCHWETNEAFDEEPHHLFDFISVPEIRATDGQTLVTLMFLQSSDRSLLKKVSEVGLQNLEDSRIKDFLEWNIADLPLQKAAMKIVLDATTMRRVQAEMFLVLVSKSGNDVQTKTEHETLSYKPLTH